MRLGWWVSWVVVVVRGAWCVWLAMSSPVGFVLGVVEGCCVGATGAGLLRGVVDSSWWGLLTPLCYAAPCLVVPTVGVWWPGLAVWLLGMLGRLWVLGALRGSVSVGVPVFVSLRTGGPYRWVRHPLALVELLGVVGVGLAYLSWWNVVALVVCVVAAVGSVVCEERFLLGIVAYRFYADGVRWRWFPKVW